MNEPDRLRLAQLYREEGQLREGVDDAIDLIVAAVADLIHERKHLAQCRAEIVRLNVAARVESHNEFEGAAGRQP